MTIYKYRLWCITEQAYKYVWASEPPTTCPTNTAHEISSDSVTVVDQLAENQVITSPSNEFMMQRDGALMEFTKNTTSTYDFKIQNHEGESFTQKYLWGADFMTINGVFGDYASFSIIDKDDVLGYGATPEAPVVVKTYVLKKYIFPNTHMSCDAFAPGSIPVGLYLRTTYTSVGTETNPKMCINYHIEVKEGA